jgi:hypothetical protein
MLPVTAQYSAGFVDDAGTMVADEIVTAPPTTPLMALKFSVVNALHCITGLTAAKSLSDPALASIPGARTVSAAAVTPDRNLK